MKLVTLLKYNFRVGIRQRYDMAIITTFTLFSAFLFPLAIGPDPEILSKVAVGLIWVLLVFALQLSVPTIWRQDVEDGTLEQLILSSTPLEIIVISKAITLWVLCLGTLLIALPFFAYTFNFEQSQLKIFGLSFMIASMPLSLLAITGATLSLGHPRASLLSIILMIPLYIPLVIFSSSAVTSNLMTDYDPSFIYILLALSLLMTPVLLMVNVLSLKWLPDL